MSKDDKENNIRQTKKVPLKNPFQEHFPHKMEMDLFFENFEFLFTFCSIFLLFVPFEYGLCVCFLFS